jgi:hypothetical protein
LGNLISEVLWETYIVEAGLRSEVSDVNESGEQNTNLEVADTNEIDRLIQELEKCRDSGERERACISVQPIPGVVILTLNSIRPKTTAVMTLIITYTLIATRLDRSRMETGQRLCEIFLENTRMAS